MKTNTLILLGVGLATAFVVYKFIQNRDKLNELKVTENEVSDFCGCGA